jgi:hypothetical protein
MPSATEPTSGSGRTVLAIGLALFFLAVIGGSVGFVLGTQELRAQARAVSREVGPDPVGSPLPTPPSGSPSADAGTASPTARPTAPPTASPTGSPAPSATSTVPPGGRSCPPETERAVVAKGRGGSLKLKLYIATSLSEVWICAGSDGQLWYQGHRRSSAGATYPQESLIDGTNAVLLPAAQVAAGFSAVNADKTSYAVFVDRLQIDGSDGTSRVEPVLSRFP